MDFDTETLPDTLTIAQPDGTTILLRDTPFVKEAKDLPSLIKRGYDAHQEVGARVRIPGKDAKPEDVTAFKQRVYDSGVFTPPPGKAEDYKLTKPETLPDGIAWNEERAGRLAQVLHKHGVPVAAAADLLALHAEALTQTQTMFKTDMDTGMATLKTEFGDKFDERYALAGRLASALFKTPEEVAVWNASGLGNHPAIMGALMRLAPLAEQDSTFLAEMHRPGGEMSGEDVRAEVAKIMSDKTHPMYAGYQAKDPKVLAHIDELYRRAYGNAPVDLRGGLQIGSAPAR